MHNILIVYYSQSGQLERVAKVIAAPLEADEDVNVDYLRLEPDPDYPFPWGFFSFLDAFPESVHLVPPRLKPFRLRPDTRYDAIIVAYTVWFLSPAPPITAFLLSPEGRKLLNMTPVITVTACRNMWLMAHEQVKRLLADAGAKHCDHVALTDQGASLATFFTTPRWMFTGRQDRWLGVFPRAGISDRDIADSRRFGHAIDKALHGGELNGSHSVLSGLGAVRVDDRLLPSERIGRRSFLVWGRLLMILGGPGSFVRKPALMVYAVFLVTMILVVVPPGMFIRMLLRPLRRERIQQERLYYELPSGSGTDRIIEFTRQEEAS